MTLPSSICSRFSLCLASIHPPSLLSHNRSLSSHTSSLTSIYLYTGAWLWLMEDWMSELEPFAFLCWAYWSEKQFDSFPWNQHNDDVHTEKLHWISTKTPKSHFLKKKKQKLVITIVFTQGAHWISLSFEIELYIMCKWMFWREII